MDAGFATHRGMCGISFSCVCIAIENSTIIITILRVLRLLLMLLLLLLLQLLLLRQLLACETF